LLFGETLSLHIKMGRRKKSFYKALTASHSRQRLSSGTLGLSKNPEVAPKDFSRGPSSTQRKRAHPVSLPLHEPQQKRYRFRKKSVQMKCDEKKVTQTKAFQRLEMKWLAVARFYQYRQHISPSHDVQQWICQELSLTTRHLHNLVKRANNTGTLIRKSGSGRPANKFELVNEALQNIFRLYGGELSQLTFTELLKQEGISASSSTVCRIFNSSYWRKKKRKILPTNTLKHQMARFKFCNKYQNESFGGDNSPILWIDIDEKNFTSRHKRIMYIPSELEKFYNFSHAPSKEPIEKVMFFGAIAKPRMNRNFDGRILLLPVCKKKIRQRKSKYGERGEIMFEKTTMTSKLFFEYCSKNLIPAIRSHLEQLPEVKKVIVQLDRAGGHGGGRANIDSMIRKLNAVGRKRRKGSPVIVFLPQPSKSPDLNTLDLGIWHSLSCGVPAIRICTKRLMDQIIHYVLQRWNTWDAWTRLQNVFDTKKKIFQIVKEQNGTNEYEIPHSNRSHAKEKPSFLPQSLDNIP
jgi:hypothetical protein